MAHEEQDYVDGWQVYSDWIDGVRRDSTLLSNYDENSTFKGKLLSCKSNLERFSLFWDDEQIRNEIYKIYKLDLSLCDKKTQSRTKKSAEESKRWRELGNKSFKDGDYTEALKQYTQAIKFAPSFSQNGTSDESMAIALANRSAALYSLTRYRFCLMDIELAIKHGYPEQNMFKLLIRKVKCLHVLSVWANDVEQIKDNLRKMLKSRDTKEYVKTEIQSMFEFLETAQPEEMEKDELDVVDETMMKISNVSKSLSQAADCVEMSYVSDKGRYMMTNKDISFGRLLVAEEPYVCNLAPSKREHYCYNCFGRLNSCGLGCTRCIQVLFCSEECREAKHATHSKECDKFLDFQEKLGVAYLVTHMMFKNDFDLNLIPIYSKKNVDKKSLDDVLNISPSDWPDLVYKNDYAAVLSLMDHATEYDYDELMGFGITATYLMTALIHQFSDSHSKLMDASTQATMGSVILRHLFQLQTNLISILDQALQELVSIGHSLSELQEQPIGVGIYPTISLFNHSCSPNILSIFHRNKFLARAAKSLECGTEINYCYGPSVNRMTKKDRQRRLKDQYFFTCGCESCSNNQENESRALLCPKCQGPVIYNQDLTNHCLKCHSESVVEVEKSLDAYNHISRRLKELSVTGNDENVKLESLKKLETDLKSLVYWRCPLFVRIKSELIECAEALEDTDLALSLCKEELDLSIKTYGEDSYEAIMTKLKLVNLMWQKLYYKIEDSETEEAKRQGVVDLKSLLSVVNETKGKLKDLLASTNIINAESSYETELKFLAGIQTSINKYIATLEPKKPDSPPKPELITS